MSTDYNYDEQGQFFPYFILTLTGLVTLPLTYSLLKPSKDLENTAPRINSDFTPHHADLIEGQKRKQRRRERRLKRFIAVLIGWAIISWMIYLIIVTARTIPKIWDPYTILGVSRSATEKAITKHYKRMSLKFHPDKVRPDPAKNETLESLNDYFVELTKAYKALTDEEIRTNYLQYGHPDGKQSYSIGIALPKFIITDGNGKYVLLVYGALLGVLLPYIVGKWWYGTQRMTKDGVLVASAGNLFQEYKEDVSEGGIVGALSAGEEYKQVLKGDKAEKGAGKVEVRVLQKTDHAPKAAGLSLRDQDKLKSLDDAQRRKTLALLWAYLGRVELDDPTLNDEKFEVAPLARNLNDAFTAISLSFGNVGPILSSYHTSQNIIQALPPGWSPLLQLPHFTPSIAQAIEGPNTKTHMSIQQFMTLSEAKRRYLLITPELLTESQYDAAIAVTKQLPALVVAKAFFKVVGERHITPSSLVQLVIKARFIPPGTPVSSIPPVNEKDLEDIDPDEDDLDAILGRKPSRSSQPRNPDGSAQPASSTTVPVQPPLAHAPYFARDHPPRWFVFLADSKQGKMAVPPFTFMTFDKPLFTESGTPTFNMQTLKMQFQAPPQVGNFTFVMHLLCDSYVGFDEKREVTLMVEDLAKVAEVEEDSISEPDEDSIAGQMAALKSGGITGAPPKKKKKPTAKKPVDEDSSEEEESDTEGEVGDTSETDTETEDEGE